jgi:hypothetical protein
MGAGCIMMASGRDAADVALSTSFLQIVVISDEVLPA